MWVMRYVFVSHPRRRFWLRVAGCSLEKWVSKKKVVETGKNGPEYCRRSYNARKMTEFCRMSQLFLNVPKTL